eukprot:3123023-Rhodomonas_salina.3
MVLPGVPAHGQPPLPAPPYASSVLCTCAPPYASSVLHKRPSISYLRTAHAPLHTLAQSCTHAPPYASSVLHTSAPPYASSVLHTRAPPYASNPAHAPLHTLAQYSIHSAPFLLPCCTEAGYGREQTMKKIFDFYREAATSLQ